MGGTNEIEVRVVMRMEEMLAVEEITMSPNRRELLALSAERGS
jgi:hypothetical protein